MAEAVIGIIAEEIVALLVSQAIETVGKLRGVKHELEALGETVSTLQAVLYHAEEQYYQSSQIQDWVKKLKDAFYDAQDVLEEFNIEAKRRELRGHNEMIKEIRTFFSSSNQLVFKLKMSNKVKVVRERIEAIKADKRLHLEERPVGLEVERRERRKRRDTYSFIPKEDVVGRDDDKKVIMEFLLNSDVKENVSILPIVGIGGLGKTALAQFVYNDEMVSKQFELKMWVCVSDDFDVIKIVKNIIACLKGQKPTDDEMEPLQRNLKEKIDEKKYLLVLDDIWEIEQETWRRLKNLLVGGARGSKILITTRFRLVAEITGTTQPYFLEGLSESASLDLLMQVARRNIEEIQDSDMLAIGKEIVRKCSGVPLVVRTVGGLLFFKKTKDEWSQFKENELLDLAQREERIKSVLRLSYDHLPSHLKQCFAFCSLFPKDYEIEKQILVNLWMAQGFIQSSDRSQPLEDIAHGYFMDLLWSNFFQDWNEETCKMHDLMHDLACSVAGTEYWRAWDPPESIEERTRHISYGSTSISELSILHSKANAVKTLFSTELMPWVVGSRVSEADLRRLIQRFKGLRILDLHNEQITKVPRSICKLKHLTYLNFSKNYELKRLPNSITRLQNLQTLNLNNCGSLEELPRDMSKLVSLQNLYIDDCGELSYMPRGLGQLSSLHRLCRFILPKKKAPAKNYSRLGELNGLKNIRGSLCIENLGSVIDAVAESTDANLIGKPFLESLTLDWGHFDDDDAVIGDRDDLLLDGLRPYADLQKLEILRYKGKSFPEWMTSLHKLVELRLRECPRSNHFPPLGLNKLKILILWWMESLECLPEEGLKTLNSLEYLDISHCHRLNSLSLGMRHLSNLRSLSIKWCEELDLCKDESGNILDFQGLERLREVSISWLLKLESLPQWLMHASNLELLEIFGCSNLKSIPEQIGALQSLQQLEIILCPLLTSLPEGMRMLASLAHLTIQGCSDLEERCERDVGEDWYKISHIPNLYFSF